MTDFKDCSTEQGRKDLIQTPIRITYSKAQFPFISLTQEEWGVSALLWLAIDDNIPLGIDADDIQQGLMMTAFLQQCTKTPLLIDKKLQQELAALSEKGLAINPMMKENGAIIPLTEILSTDTDKETYKQLEAQFYQDEKLKFTEVGGMLN